MDQPATAQKSRLNAGPGNIEIIETSRIFPRPGIVTGIDSLRRHLPYVLWTGCHRVPLRNATRVPGDNYDERRIASSRNVPERSGHCLTRMLPWPRHFGNRRPIGSSDWHPKDPAAWGTGPGPACPGGDSARPAFLFDRRACFPVPTWRRQSRGAQPRGWEERSHPEPGAARCCARAWRGWRAPDLPRSEHRGTLRTSRRARPSRFYLEALEAFQARQCDRSS